MKADLLMARMDALTSQLIDDQLAQPPTAEELDWIEDMTEIQKLFAFEKPGDERETRRLYWEWRLGAADWLDDPLDPDDFVSEAAYQKCL